MDDQQRNDQGRDRDRGNYNHQHRNRNFRHDRHGGRHGGGGGGHQMHRGRPQRPLLTSSINAAGLSLVALTMLAPMKDTQMASIKYLGWAVVFFGISSFVSYIAQRVKPAFVEKLSDILFLAGVVLLVWVAGSLSGLWMI